MINLERAEYARARVDHAKRAYIEDLRKRLGNLITDEVRIAIKNRKYLVQIFDPRVNEIREYPEEQAVIIEKLTKLGYSAAFLRNLGDDEAFYLEISWA